MKKFGIFTLFGALLCSVAFSLTSCKPKVTLKEEGAELITIYLRDFEVWSNDHFIDAIEEFNEDLTDGIEIQYKIFDNSAIGTAIAAAQQAGDNLDIYLVSYSNLFEQVNTESIVPVEDYVDESFLDDYTDAARSATTLYDKVYAIPYCFEASQLLFYSKSMFQQAGITKEPTTYQEMLDCCDKLSKVIDFTQTVVGTAIGVPMGWANLGQFWNAANGRYPISDDWSESLVGTVNRVGYAQFLNYYTQLYRKDYASRVDSAGGYNEIIGELCEGRVAMTYAGSYAIGQIYNEYIEQGVIDNADDIGLCYGPKLHQDQSSTFVGGWSFVLNAGCADKDCTAEKALGKKRGELAAQFLDWYVRGEQGQAWFELGRCCKQTGFKSMQQKLDVSQLNNPYYEILKEASNTAPDINCYPYQITQKLANMIVGMMLPTSQATADDVINEAHTEIEQIITQYKLAGKNPR
ncbi:MAG: ABC transporter substrate-binding protein [Bacilli bacterium]|jgi:ABC-type glycerol-3-phosphate transport system substrate-binding protein